MDKKVTLYITNYNTGRYLEDCLKGVLNQTYPIDESFIVDGGSTDDSLEIAEKYGIPMIFQDGKGLANARNVAFRKSRNEFVATLDSDCLPEPEWLETLMLNFTEEKIAGTGGALHEKYTQKIADKWREVYLAQNQGDKHIYDSPGIYGNNSVLRKSAVVSAGLFDERFKAGGEDWNISIKLKRLGYVFIYEPKAVVWHLKTDTISSVLSTNWRHRFFGHTMPVTKYITFRAIISNFIDAIRKIINDIKNRRYSLVITDFILPFYSSYKAICTYFNRKSYKYTPDLTVKCWCSSKNFKFLFAFPKADIYECCKCGLWRSYPEPGKTNSAQEEKKGNMQETIHKVELINKFSVGRKPKILRIGLNNGHFQKALEDNKWQVSHIKDLPFDTSRFLEKEFDVVLVSYVIESTSDIKKALEKIRYVLKDNGLLIIKANDVSSLLYRISGIWKILRIRVETFGYVWHFTRKKLENIVCKSGFSIVNISPLTYKDDIKPGFNLREMIKSMISMMERLFGKGSGFVLIARKDRA